MDQQEYATTIVGVASEHYNDRLRAVADGQEAEVAHTDGRAERVGLVGARPFLFSGMDVDLDALEGLAAGAVSSVFADVMAHGGELREAELAALLEGMFATGILHERERLRREGASADAS
jgi:hypothetical protein